MIPLTNIIEVKSVLSVIKKAASAGDHERAHELEDDLHQAVLQAIADGTAKDPENMAKAALESLNLDFERWYA